MVTKRMMIALAGAMLLLSVAPVQASVMYPKTASSGMHEQDATKKARLTERATGKTIELPVEVFETVSDAKPNELGRKHERTYTVRVPKSTLVPGSLQNLNSSSSSQNDGAISMEATLTQVWYQTENGGRTYARMPSISGSWRRLDSQVYGNNAYLKAACNGDYMDSGWCYRQETFSVGVPTYEQTYYGTPSWDSSWVEVNENAGMFQCAQTSIHLSRGGSSWDLWFNICQGSNSLSWS